MCISKQASLYSLLFGIFCGSLLIVYSKTVIGRILGYFFIYVAFMQGIDYFIWSDLGCSKGLNKIASIIGPIIHHTQPIILLYLLKRYSDIKHPLFDTLYYPILLVYSVYVSMKYMEYLMNSDGCTKVGPNGHLNWTWTYNVNYIFYHLIFLFILLTHYQSKDVVVSIIYSYMLFIFSFSKFRGNVGELWCLMATSSPLITLLYQNLNI